MFRISVFLLLFVAGITGCVPRLRKPERICRGAETVVDSLSLLKGHWRNKRPFKASGQCLLEYYSGGKKHRENFPVKLWVNPPAEIYMQGDAAFDPRGVVVGSNEREFWLSIRLKEVSSYWWGRWAEEKCLEGLMISPKLVLEAFGIFQAGDGENWSLQKKDIFDEVTRRDAQGVAIKKVYMDRCDYLVKRIEYFGTDGQAVVVMEPDKYKEVCEGFLIPTVIKTVKAASGGSEDSIKITLDSVKPATFTEKQQSFLFSRPEPEGFKHVYKFNENCEMIEQQQ